MMRKLTASAIAAVLPFALVACGDDNEDGAASQAEYCAIEAEIDALFNAAFSATEPPTPEAMAEVATQVLQFADEAVAAAPDEIADEVEVLFGATEEMADGNPAAFDTPEAQAAGNTIDEFCPVADQ